MADSAQLDALGIARQPGRSDSDGTLPLSANYGSVFRPCLWNPEAGRIEWATPPKATTEGKPLPPTTNLRCPWKPCHLALTR